MHFAEELKLKKNLIAGFCRTAVSPAIRAKDRMFPIAFDCTPSKLLYFMLKEFLSSLIGCVSLLGILL